MCLWFPQILYLIREAGGLQFFFNFNFIVVIRRLCSLPVSSSRKDLVLWPFMLLAHFFWTRIKSHWFFVIPSWAIQITLLDSLYFVVSITKSWNLVYSSNLKPLCWCVPVRIYQLSLIILHEPQIPPWSSNHPVWRGYLSSGCLWLLFQVGCRMIPIYLRCSLK